MNAHPSCLLSWILKIAVIRSQYYLSLLFSVPAIPWTEVLSGLQSSGSQRAGQDWMTKHSLTPSEVMLVSIMFAAASALKLFVSCYSRVTGIWGFPASLDIPWRRAWLPTPVFLENNMDRGAWLATVHRVTKSRTWLKQLGTNNWNIVSFKKLFEYLIPTFFHWSRTCYSDLLLHTYCFMYSGSLSCAVSSLRAEVF